MKKYSGKILTILMILTIILIQVENFNFFKKKIVEKSNNSLKNSEIVERRIFKRETTDLTTTPSLDSKYSNLDYVINKYDINIIVNENNTLDIIETITAYFNVPKHGIFRTIPARKIVSREDGTTTLSNAKLSKLKVNEKYVRTRENDNYKIKIGKEDETITGEKEYVISYNYNLGADKLKDRDEFYFNLIGTDWDTVIGNVSFTITMPKEFVKQRVGFSSGKYGSLDNKNITYNIVGNTIKGNYNGILGKYESLTIRCELPEGYFTATNNYENVIYFLVFAVPITALLISIIIWYVKGKDEPVVTTVEFYPPAGLNSLEVGHLYRGSACNKDVTSLLIYLANKGYIQIIECDKKSIFSITPKFKIRKLKEYDGNDPDEKLFLEGLFKKRKIPINIFKESQKLYERVEEVTSIDLRNNFYITNEIILSNVNSDFNESRIFEESESSKIIIYILILISFLMITVPPSLDYGTTSDLTNVLVLPIILYAIFQKIAINLKKSLSKYYSPLETVLSIALYLFMFILGTCEASVLTMIPIISQNKIYEASYMIGIVCIITMTLLIGLLPKRTTYGTEMLGKIRGFKNFLKTAEKDKIEKMVFDNPSYFYDVLPYAYVLGVSNRWIKKFEDITLPPPTWYYSSSNSFNIPDFNKSIGRTMSSASSSMSSRPSSSSRGGGHGGGHSGGGHGGGGGGSW